MMFRIFDFVFKQNEIVLRARLVHCNDYYMWIGISITINTLSWNVISITIHSFGDHYKLKQQITNSI